MDIDRPTLRALGFCGIDDTVAPELLAAISSRWCRRSSKMHQTIAARDTAAAPDTAAAILQVSLHRVGHFAPARDGRQSSVSPLECSFASPSGASTLVLRNTRSIQPFVFLLRRNCGVWPFVACMCLVCVWCGGAVVSFWVDSCVGRSPRSFASEAYLAKLQAVNAGRTMRLAGHLCSSRCEEVLHGDARYVTMLYNEVGRVLPPLIGGWRGHFCCCFCLQYEKTIVSSQTILQYAYTV